MARPTDSSRIFAALSIAPGKRLNLKQLASALQWTAESTERKVKYAVAHGILFLNSAGMVSKKQASRVLSKVERRVEKTRVRNRKKQGTSQAREQLELPLVVINEAEISQATAPVQSEGAI